MANYYEKIQYLYPGIQRVVYWQTQYDGTPWDNLYDGIVWENEEIEKPSQEQLDNLDDALVEQELSNRHETERKAQRDTKAKVDLGLVAQYRTAKSSDANLTFSQFLDSLEELAEDL